MIRRKTIEESNEKGRVAIFFWEDYLGAAPSIINAVRVLATAGYHVDVITRHDSAFPPPPNFPTSVQLLMQASGRSGARAVSREDQPLSRRATALFERLIDTAYTIRTLIPERFKKALRRLPSQTWGHIRRRSDKRGDSLGYDLLGVLRFLVFSIQNTRRRHYTCFIGVDMMGLMIATIAGLGKGKPILYWSLEIRYANELNRPLDRLLKRLERLCNHRAVLTIIQDKERSNSLTVENEIDPAKVIIVPNGPLGRPPQLRSDFLRRKFGLRRNRRIILHIGQTYGGLLSLELAKAAAKWPDDWVLIFHESSKREYSEPYIKEVREAGAGKVLQSLEPLPYDELDTLVASGEVGIVLYRKDLGPNYALAGSSGKVGQYLRCGLPVVCADLPGLSGIIHKYQCGICVRSVAEIREATEQIFREYYLYSANAVRCYQEVYEFGRHFQQVLKQIEKFDQEGRPIESRH